jgi:hypothetical protein
MNNFNRAFSFGRKGLEVEKKTPAEALRGLYESDDEVRFLVDSFAKKQEQVLVFNDVTPEDRSLLNEVESELIEALEQHGISVTEKTLDEFLKTF